MSYEESKLLSLLKKQDIDSLFLEATNYLYQTKSLFEEKEQLQQENERLRIQIRVREAVCDRLAGNWNLLKRYCYEIENDENTKLNGLNVLDKMQELEQGSDE